MVRQNLQRDVLLRYRHHSLFVHVRVVYAHTAEDGEGLDEVLVVLGEGQVVELVDELDDADDLARGILDGHAKDGLVLETRAIVDALVEAGVFVRVGYVDGLGKAMGLR